MSLQKAVYGFVPTSITGCQVWLDGVDSSTVSFSSGSNVSSWSDKSGNGRNATVYAGTPTYTSALGMTFNGSSSLQITYTASPTIESMFVIIKFNSVSGQGDILSGTASGQREYLMYVPYSPGTIYLGRHSTGPSGAINGGTVTTGSNYLLEYVFNGTGNTISFFQSGNTITSGTPQFTYSAGGTISVIGSYNGGGYLQGQIYEMIIYSTALGTTERQQVEGYLAQKWGLTSSLPASHPGRSTTLYRSDYTKQNVMTARPYYVAFSPRQIPGCALWLDAVDTSTITMATGVSQWNDKSGNSYNLTQGTGSLQPTRTGNFLNFQSNYYLNIPTSSINNTSSYSFFFVFNPIASLNWILQKQYNGVGSYNMISMTNYWQTSVGVSAYLYWTAWANPGPFANSGAALSLSTIQLIEITFDGTTLTIYRNGNQLSTSVGSYTIPNATSVTNFTLGSWIADGSIQNNNTTNFQLGEFLYYNTFLNTTQRQQVESYLAQKWGLTASLPGGHSHATQPAGAITRTALANLRLVIQPRRYTSFRWTITAGNTESLIQFSEFQVGFNSTQLVFASPTTATTGSSISWNTGAGEGPAQAVDNNINTKGLGIGTSGLVLIVTVATPIAANMYRWATANDVTPGRNPTQWTVDGSADNATYVRLHTQNTAYSTPSSTFTFTSWIPFTYS